jgi:CO/xanthine dehydrogenase FAD-binding subunit
MMPFRVETFDRLEDAARALSSARNARFLGGGTLVMRAVNDGSQSFDTIVRGLPDANEIRRAVFSTDPVAEGLPARLGLRTYLGRVTKAHILAAVREAVGDDAAEQALAAGGEPAPVHPPRP